MTRKLAEWPFEIGQTEKVGPSDGRRGDALPLAAESKYDYRELGAYLGDVGSYVSRSDTVGQVTVRQNCTGYDGGRNCGEGGRRMTDEASQNAKPESAPPKVDGSPVQVAEMVGAAVAIISQRWLHTAVTVASAIKNGKAVSNGTFGDMRELREKYEELERARLVLHSMGSADKTASKPSKN